MNTNNSGIFDSITELCEKFEKDRGKIKHVRSKCYELLLGKRTSKIKKSEGTSYTITQKLEYIIIK